MRVLPFVCVELLQNCRNTQGESCRAEEGGTIWTIGLEVLLGRKNTG